MPEAKIKIGRYHLNPAQSMTVRVALAAFEPILDRDTEDLTDHYAAYKRRTAEVMEMIQLTQLEKKYAKP